MKHRDLFYTTYLFLILAAFLFLPSEKSSAFPVPDHLDSAFEAENNADLVCKVQVLSLRQDGVVKNDHMFVMRDTPRMVASSKVLSVIKGKCPQIIDIEFHKLDYIPYADLAVGQVCLVFLKKSDPYYKFSPLNGKLWVQPKVIDYNLGDTPNFRLLAEFLASCQSGKGVAKLQAIEQLGYLGEAIMRDIRSNRERLSRQSRQKIKSALLKTRQLLLQNASSDDLVTKSLALISSFQAVVSPGIEGPLQLLRANPSHFDPNDSLKKYGTRDYCIPKLQSRLLEMMDHTTRRAIVNLEDFSVIRPEDGRPGIFRGVPGFDYAAFFKQALECEVVKNNTGMRSAIANVIWIRNEKTSVPEMIRLLDDSSMYVRFVAVDSLRKYTDQNLPPLQWEKFGEKEQEYVEYLKKWWQDNKERFKTLESD